MGFALHSDAFVAGHPIPDLYTSDGADLTPELSWSGAPPGTRSFALVVEDPDAPDPRKPQRIWVHWVLYNLPPEVHELAKGLDSHRLPHGATEGRNDWGHVGWAGPNPPVGEHRYFFRLHALDTVLPAMGEPTRTQLDAAMKGHLLATASLMGTYQKRH